MSDKTPTVRERLLAAARELFYTNGITATGIDSITRQARVAKMSLYNNFPSKAALVAAYIEERNAEWTTLYERRKAEARSPEERVLAVFDAYMDQADLEYSAHGFKGCGMLNAAAELDLDSPVRVTIKQHKEGVKSLLEKHLLEIPPVDRARAPGLAELLSFILEGAMVCSGLEGNSGKMRAAKGIVTALLKDIRTPCHD